MAEKDEYAEMHDRETRREKADEVARSGGKLAPERLIEIIEEYKVVAGTARAVWMTHEMADTIIDTIKDLVVAARRDATRPEAVRVEHYRLLGERAGVSFWVDHRGLIFEQTALCPDGAETAMRLEDFVAMATDDPAFEPSRFFLGQVP